MWEGWFGYDRKKYAAMLRELYPVSECWIYQQAPIRSNTRKTLANPHGGDDLVRYPLTLESAFALPAENLRLTVRFS
ncbi:MAG: hypothetical protein DMG42_02425 [Acidobacteria bacterium]|nr:MAG: hypothetical protein DMG42_02425 [Acidobacteriota bacterium]